MNIAIDARWIFKEISGIGAYTRELIRHLPGLDARHHYTLFFQHEALCRRTLDETGVGGAANVTTRLLPYGLFSPLNQIRLPLLLRTAGIDLYHSTNYMIPLPGFSASAGRPRALATIHDVIPLLFPDHAPESRKARLFPLYRHLMRQIGRRTAAILTDSDASARDIIAQLDIPPGQRGKVHAIPCGVSERFRPPAARRPRAAGESRRILYVGRADPYKNLTTLVAAFAQVRPRLPFPARLILAGSPDPRYPDAERAAQDLGVRDHVEWTGYLADDALVRLYQDADVLAHPSRYEGFGLQVAEAMACGLPVVCSNAGSLPEVAGDAAVLLAPDDTAGFAAALGRVLTDSAFAQDLAARGLRRAPQFTWRRTAEATLAVYAQLAPKGAA